MFEPRNDPRNLKEYGSLNEQLQAEEWDLREQFVRENLHSNRATKLNRK